MKVISLCAGVGFLGLVGTVFVPGQGGAMAFGVAGLGLCASLFLALLTDGGRKPGRMPLALILGFVVGSLVGVTQVLRSNQATASSSSQSRSSERSDEDSSDEDRSSADEDAAGESADSSDEPEDVDPDSEPGFEGGDGAEDGSADADAGGEQDALMADAGEADSSDGLAEASRDPSLDTPTKTSKSEKPPNQPTPSTSSVTAKTPAKSKPPKTPAKKEESKSLGGSSTGLQGGPRESKLERRTEKQPKGDAEASGPSRFVVDTIISNNGAIKRCIEDEQKRGGDPSGALYLVFTIAPSGSVSKAYIKTSRWRDTDLDICMSRVVNNLDFPPFEGKPTKIKYKMLIQ